MITTLDPAELPLAGAPAAVVSVGVFDGVHLGHQAILEANLACARENGLRPTVVTFRGHPKRVILGRAPKTLTTLEHRLALFERAGIEHTLALAFTEELRAMSPERFIDEILVRGLGAQAFVLGFDSKFGKDRAGGPELLAELGHRVQVVPRVSVAQRAISSTAIREAVELGDLEGAERMLGRPVTVLGTVVHGQALGRTLGFPTANLDLHHGLHPPAGVYAGLAHLAESSEPLAAVANIGTRPTLAGKVPAEPTVEVHILDFQGDLYDQRMEFEFAGRLRSERPFEDLEQLRTQIGLDVEQARDLLRRRNRDARG